MLVWLQIDLKQAEFWQAQLGDNWSHADGLGAPYDLVREDNKFMTDVGRFDSHESFPRSSPGEELAR